MNAYFQDDEGKRQPILMASYGIGISRTLMAVVEQHSTEKGLIWPKALSPFDIHLIPLNAVDG